MEGGDVECDDVEGGTCKRVDGGIARDEYNDAHWYGNVRGVLMWGGWGAVP